MCVATIFTNVYKDIWEAAIGEELPFERETMNTKDRYAVTEKRWHGGRTIFRVLQISHTKIFTVPLQLRIPRKFLHCKFNYGYGMLLTHLPECPSHWTTGGFLAPPGPPISSPILFPITVSSTPKMSVRRSARFFKCEPMCTPVAKLTSWFLFSSVCRFCSSIQRGSSKPA